jgi:NAD(P)-dependent dehydrogenase (short-subunit alcohol dehydrogenase family)
MMMNSGIADMSAVAQGLPVRRMGKPEEVARAVLWLASNAASFRAQFMCRRRISCQLTSTAARALLASARDLLTDG